MKTSIHLWAHLAQFLEWKMFQAEFAQKIKSHILCSITFFFFLSFFRKSCRLWDNVEKYSRPGQVTDYNIILRMRIASWIPKATNTHSQYVATMAARTRLKVLLGAYSRRLDGRELVVMGYKQILTPCFLTLNPNETNFFKLLSCAPWRYVVQWKYNSIHSWI